MTIQLARNNPYMKMVVNILHVGNMIDKKVTEVLKEFDITHVQFNVLRILEVEYPGTLSQSDIGNNLFFPSSDVSRIIDRLEKRKLIVRKICPVNRRKVDISITQKGLEVIVKSLPKIEKILKGFYKNLVSEEEREIILNALRKIKIENR